MKICFVCSEYPPFPHGGIGTMVQTLGQALAASGHQVRVVGVYPGVSADERETDGGVDVWRLPRPRRGMRGLVERRRVFQRVAAWARSGAIDLVEVPDYQGWAARWPRLPVPVVARLHGSSTYFAQEMGRRASWLTTTVEKSSLRRCDFWCSVSRYTAEKTQALFGLSRGPDAILPNPVPLGPDVPWAGRQPEMVVFSGTLTEKKGVVPLMDAWRTVSAHSRGARLHVLGKDGAAPGGGSMTKYLRLRLGSAASSVTFHGQVTREQVAEYLKQARVAVFPSFAEAFAIAPLEAMACGCPTIGTALGSGPELLTHGVDGLMVDPRVPAQIAEMISQLLNDESTAQRIGERGRDTIATRYSTDRLLAANVGFYRRCVTGQEFAAAGSRPRADVEPTIVG